jgi:hypothetical protein
MWSSDSSFNLTRLLIKSLVLSGRSRVHRRAVNMTYINVLLIQSEFFDAWQDYTYIFFYHLSFVLRFLIFEPFV